jgi:predicted RecB family nuclease
MTHEDPAEVAEGIANALRRSFERARTVARQTGTKMVIVHEGRVLRLDPDDPFFDIEPSKTARGVLGPPNAEGKP